MANVLDTLRSRGFVKQVVFEEELYKLLDSQSVTFYSGFDPTADSLHVGHFVLLMALAHMQRAGHKPIVLVGGGTVIIGDPSGRTDMRQMLDGNSINNNVERFKQQISRFIDFSDDKALMVNNAEWLMNINYLEFMRDIGVHFSVNKMLTAECFKSRMERGLTFFEFNYMLLQAYDFLRLNRTEGAVLQMGGDDQWSNMLAGADLIRRKERKDAFVLTIPLLTTADGRKMGKTQAGLLWCGEPYGWILKKLPPMIFISIGAILTTETWKNALSCLLFCPSTKSASFALIRMSALIWLNAGWRLKYAP